MSMLTRISHGPVLELCMNRPPVNALNPELVQELNDAIKDAGDQASALVISGREGLFSAGLDVPELMQLDRPGMSEFWRNFFGLLETVARSPIPVAAAITGHAPAGGAVLCLFCDYRAMSKGKYVIGLNETQVGLLVPEVIRQALIRLTGPHRAERMIVAGALLSPEQAHSDGMIDELADSPADTVQAAVNWCETHLALPAHAMLGNRQLMRQDACERFDLLGEKEVKEFVDGWFDEPTQVTLRAVLEKLKRKS
jgi:3,2-trans-enoyl-CoA isomerase